MECIGHKRAGVGLAFAVVVALLGLLLLAGCAAGDTNFTNVVTSGYATIAGNAAVGGTFQVTGNSNLAAVYAKQPILNKTGAYTLTAAETGALLSNLGATGNVTVTLPTAAAGLRYCFAVAASQTILVDPASTNQILALTNAGGDKITNGTAGGGVCLVGVSATQWVPQGTAGTWADGN